MRQVLAYVAVDNEVGLKVMLRLRLATIVKMRQKKREQWPGALLNPLLSLQTVNWEIGVFLACKAQKGTGLSVINTLLIMLGDFVK